MDFSELESVSPIFNELLEFVKTIVVYCDILREIKVKREHIRNQENEMEKCINVLQQMSIERNKVENDLIDLRQQLTNEQSEKIRIENLLLETNQRLVSHHSLG